MSQILEVALLAEIDRLLALGKDGLEIEVELQSLVQDLVQSRTMD